MIIKHDYKTWAIKISTILFFILLKNIILYLYHVLTSTIIAQIAGKFSDSRCKVLYHRNKFRLPRGVTITR